MGVEQKKRNMRFKKNILMSAEEFETANFEIIRHRVLSSTSEVLQRMKEVGAKPVWLSVEIIGEVPIGE